MPPLGGAKEAKAIGLNKEKASALRRWPVSKAYSLRGNHPFDGWSSFIWVDVMTAMDY